MDGWVLCAYPSADNHEVEKMVHWRIISVASNGFARTSSRELVSNKMRKGENGHSRVSNPKNWQEKTAHHLENNAAQLHQLWCLVLLTPGPAHVPNGALERFLDCWSYNLPKSNHLPAWTMITLNSNIERRSLFKWVTKSNGGYPRSKNCSSQTQTWYDTWGYPSNSGSRSLRLIGKYKRFFQCSPIQHRELLLPALNSSHQPCAARQTHHPTDKRTLHFAGCQKNSPFRRLSEIFMNFFLGADCLYNRPGS